MHVYIGIDTCVYVYSHTHPMSIFVHWYLSIQILRKICKPYFVIQ